MECGSCRKPITDEFQLCVICDKPTGQCTEDALHCIKCNTGPLCPDCMGNGIMTNEGLEGYEEFCKPCISQIEGVCLE